MSVVAMLVAGIFGILRQPPWWPFVNGALIGLFNLQIVNAGRSQLGLGSVDAPRHLAVFIILSYIAYSIGGVVGRIARWATKRPNNGESTIETATDPGKALSTANEGDNPYGRQHRQMSVTEPLTEPSHSWPTSLTGIVSWAKSKSIASAAVNECKLYREGRLPKFRKLMIDDLLRAWPMHCSVAAEMKGDDWPLDVLLQEFSQDFLEVHLGLAALGRIPLTPLSHIPISGIPSGAVF